MKDVFKNKRLWIGIGGGILAVALIVGMVLLALSGDNHNNPNPTVPTGTTAGTDAPTSNDATEPSATNPDDPTSPTNGPIADEPDYDEPVEDPDDPSLSDPTEPSTPNGEIPDIAPPPGPNDDEDEDPIGGNGSAEPTGPVEVPDDDDNPDTPVETPKPTERPIDKTQDFGGVTPSTITLDIWLSWDGAKSQAFVDTYGDQYLSWDLDTRWRWNCVISQLSDPYYKDGFYCSSEEDYKDLVARFNEPCDYCGKSCCKDTLYRTKNGMSAIDPRRCSEYDIYKDPLEYCQDCGLKKGDDGCVKFMYDANCDDCGEWVEAMTCHHCKKYHD